MPEFRERTALPPKIRTITFICAKPSLLESPYNENFAFDKTVVQEQTGRDLGLGAEEEVRGPQGSALLPA